MLALGPLFLGLGVTFFALGAKGTGGVSLQLGRTLLLLCTGLSALSLALYALG